LFSLAIKDNRLYAAGYVVSGGTIMGVVAAYLLTSPVTCPPSFNVTIPNAISLDKGVDVNTVYPGYAPASQITLVAKASGGREPYSYLWQNGTPAGSITVAPSADVNYVVTVTDALGCKTTASKQVYAVNVRCGNNDDKVMVCQIAPGNSKVKSVCVAQSAVSTLLRNSSKLGTCTQPTGTNRLNEAVKEMPELLVWPNPTSTSFKLKLNSLPPGSYTLLVRDALGRIVEQRKVNSQQVIELGANYQPGLYSVSLAQESNTITKQVVKQ
jgi:hypothetical protein